ncbi:hypothetical protein AB1Y20_012214 [Prymnesium parvum]|uniref:Cilia- and flagella-associated protein 99 n=1 Tax=Prymnesium parvum TaxID=97485 RepID=A0AB34IQL2_PRYPA
MQAELSAERLIAACEEAVRTYEPAKTTVDTHTDQFNLRKKISDPDDQLFVQQVVYGCLRYKKMLKIVLSSLYFKHSGETQRGDYTLYTVFAYLAIVRLHELGFSAFRSLVLSQEHFKMSIFLKFLFNQETVNNWLRPEWLKMFEPSFVDEQLIAKLLVFAPNVHNLLQILEGRMASEAAKKEAAAEAARALAEGRGGKGEHTTPVPFQLTEPKPRSVPNPEEVITKTFKANKVPTSTYRDAKQLPERIELDQKKDLNRMQMKAKYSNPKRQPFKLRVTERPSNLSKVREEVEAAREAECHFEGPKANPVPRPRAGQGAVRLNSAAILREDILYRKKQEGEAAVLSAYEQELRDASEFESWQKRMLAQDEQSRLEEVERRRIATIIADEEAKEARARKLNENRALAMIAKREAHEALHQLQAEEHHRKEEARQLVRDVQAARERPVLAMEEVAKQNRLKAQELREETERLEAQAAEEKRVEEAKRADLIQQIRALELVPRKRITALDPTYVPQHGLLEQMSLAELRERLAVVEQDRSEEVSKRRANIVSSKQERELDLSQRAQRLTEMRELAASQAAAKRDALREANKLAERQRQDRLAEAQLKVHETIEAKRATRRREEAALAAELKSIRIKNQYLGVDKATVERKNWESQQAGAQREVIARQQQRHEDAKHIAQKRDSAQRVVNRSREQKVQETFLKEYEQHLEEAKVDSELEKAQVLGRQAQLRTMLNLGQSQSAKLAGTKQDWGSTHGSSASMRDEMNATGIAS